MVAFRSRATPDRLKNIASPKMRPEPDMTDPQSPHFRHAEPPPATADSALAEDAGPMKAWEEVAAGRFMPKRIRGSCIGRALG